MTASEPGECHPAAGPKSEAVDGFIRVSRAGGQMAAMEPHQSRQRITIETDQAASGRARRAREMPSQPMPGSNETHRSSNSLPCCFDLFEVSTQTNITKSTLASPVGGASGGAGQARIGNFGLGSKASSGDGLEIPAKSREIHGNFRSAASCGKIRRARSSFRARPESAPPLKRTSICGT